MCTAPPRAAAPGGRVKAHRAPGRAVPAVVAPTGRRSRSRAPCSRRALQGPTATLNSRSSGLGSPPRPASSQVMRGVVTEHRLQLLQRRYSAQGAAVPPPPPTCRCCLRPRSKAPSCLHGTNGCSS